MNILLLLFFLHCNQVNPNAAPQHIAGVATVEQALINLNKDFPTWAANYQDNSFDCSNMSALVYDYLKACGLNPKLHLGIAHDLPGYSGVVGHAWVCCQGKTIEATALAINNNPVFYAAFKPVIFTEYDLTKNSEFNWWDSKYIIETEGK